MRKIVINDCYGGFGLNYEACMEYARRTGITLYGFKHVGQSDSFLPILDAKNAEKEFVIYYYTTPDKQQGSSWSDSDLARDNPVLVALVEEWGERAADRHADLKIVEIPDDVLWEIEEYDGQEWIAEVHRRWP